MDKIQETVSKIRSLDSDLMQKAQAKLDNLTKPRGSLGRLEELAKQIVGITGDINSKLNKKTIIVMASDHGVVNEGVSAYPKDVTAQMVYNFLSGDAGINVLAKHIGAEVKVVDVGVASDLGEHPFLVSEKVDFGTKNMAKGPAMTKKQALKSIQAGIEVVEDVIRDGCDIIGTGDMGIGNTTASSAIASVTCQADVNLVTGHGTGIDESGLEHKINVIKGAIALNKPDSSNAIDVLAKIGGFEIGGIAGVILGASANRIPVVIDGFISGAGALVAASIAPKSKDFMIASHCSVEKGHRIVLEKLGLNPLFDFNMRLGEGTGAALGMNIAEASVKILNEMATFEEAGVSEKK